MKCARISSVFHPMYLSRGDLLKSWTSDAKSCGSNSNWVQILDDSLAPTSEFPTELQDIVHSMRNGKNLTVFQGKLKKEEIKIKQRHDDTQKQFVDLKDKRNNLKTKVTSVSLTYKNIWNKGNKNNIMFSDFLEMNILYDTSLTHPIQYVRLRKMW